MNSVILRYESDPKVYEIQSEYPPYDEVVDGLAVAEHFQKNQKYKHISSTLGDYHIAIETKVNKLNDIGLDHCINHQVEDFSEAVMRLTGGKGVNLIIDHVGGPFLDGNLRCMALKGRLVSVGRLGGQHADLNLDFVALRRLHIIGVTFRTRTIMERIEIARRWGSPRFHPGLNHRGQA